MNSKIKNYVDVLFKDIPNTKKAMELKEEILSTLNDHFEAHIAEGKSENQAYTEALANLGDIDSLLKELEPDMSLKNKIDDYRRIRARNTSISVMLYILSVVFVIIFSSIPSIFGIGQEESMSIIGVVLMFICIAIATGLIIFTHMSMPQDVGQYISKSSKPVIYNGSNKKIGKFVESFSKLYWSIILIIYLAVSFTTNAWHITWIIWIIGTAIKNAVYAFLDISEEE
ncbi:MAG: permease prefix domain 1-containing protein [Treponema sp.]|nr:permease prefix domain 1-containing protein [Treponema sp.]